MTILQRLFAAFVIWLVVELGYAIYISFHALRAAKGLLQEIERAFDEEMKKNERIEGP